MALTAAEAGGASAPAADPARTEAVRPSPLVAVDAMGGDRAPGEVVAGHVGSDDRMEFTLIGVPVNNSAYLSKVRPARVLMSEATRARVPGGMKVSGHQALMLKGAREPQAIYELT